MKRNVPLPGSYLFPEISRRVAAFKAENPDADLINLGIGDVTDPLPLDEFSMPKNGGYGPPFGLMELREAIAEKIYKGIVSPDEIFISDGAKCDTGRLQLLFGRDATVSVQDPAYPVYIESSLLAGKRIVPWPEGDLLFLCSPNNPTGEVATREEIQSLMGRGMILFDSAYSAFVDDPTLPRSIFEVEGARECAIEIGSFSKMAGFTGIRLGWTVVPKELVFDDGSSVHRDWSRLMSTLFNGASIPAQLAGIHFLDEHYPWKQIAVYRDQTRALKEVLGGRGGDHAPYIWVEFPGEKSWDLFDRFLHEHQLITTPGSGFGPAGEGFLRFSSLGSRVDEAAVRLREEPATLAPSTPKLSTPH